ncbi:SSI family serine proteinase inhibitor [Streptomyces sp. NPDC002889]|uniref:SSI family serine proteinase inhibitor n=1 Tax=Streptomyces sp. NPDC002889 TaxID=3364669 RepID=UPI0036B4BDAE
MLRHLVLTAIVSAAALTGAAPAAAAGSPLPLPLEPVLDGRVPDRLTLVVAATGNPRTDGTYELECGPAGGSHPSAQSACARLDQLAREGRDPFAPVPERQMCTQQSGGPANARITGTWQGRHVDASFSRANGCEISRWKSLEPVLPNTRS